MDGLMVRHKGMPRRGGPSRPDPVSSGVDTAATARTWSLGSVAGVAVIVVATAILYGPALNHQFTNWDDDRQVTGNADIRDLSLAGIRKIFTSTTVSLYQPLTSLVFALEYHVAGLDPRVYHGVCVLVHLANIVLVYVFVRRLCCRKTIAVMVAGLFAVHPLQVEAVAWVSSLSILLSSLFYLAAMVLYLTYSRTGKLKYLAAVGVLFILALLAKTSAATLPLALLVIDLYLQRRPLLRVLLEKVPLLALSALFGAITMASRGGASHVQDFATRYSLVQRASIVCYSCLWYVGKLIVPTPLSAFCPFPDKVNGSLPWPFTVAPILLAGMVAAVWFSGRARRLLTFAGLFTLACLLLVVQVVPISELMVCDRYAYVPCIGLFLVVATAAWAIGSRGLLFKAAATTAAGLALVLCAGLTYERIGVWRDSLTLWNDVIAKHDHIWAAYLNRGLAESQAGDYTAAIEDFNATLQLNPKSEMALNNRAGCYTYLRNWPAALRDFDGAIQVKPNPDYFVNRGILKQRMGDTAGALRDFDTVIETHPRHGRAMCERADAYRAMGNWPKAIADYQALLAAYPEHAYAAFWLGAVLLETGDCDRAVTTLNEAIRLGYQQPGAAHFLIGMAYQRLGKRDLATESLQKAHQLGDSRAMVELRRMQ
jgi:tetratricopeptide (TPR) repeat protein